MCFIKMPAYGERVNKEKRMYTIYKVASRLPEDNATPIPEAQILAQGEDHDAMCAAFEEYSGEAHGENYGLVLVGPDGVPMMANS
jgi:hypothetical protein